MNMPHRDRHNAIKQAVLFFAVSGSGWVMDFGVFSLLTEYGKLRLAYANMLSSVPAITLVFLVSTRKIFLNCEKGLPIWGKYIVYFLYQILLVFSISWIGDGLCSFLSQTDLIKISFVAQHIEILCKIIITPITMTCNFIVMKLLIERI